MTRTMQPRKVGATPPTWSLSTMPTVSMTREGPPGLPLRERQRDEPSPVRFGSSPEHGLPALATNLGGLPMGPPTGARLDVVHAVPASRRGLSRDFCLGNRPSCATLAHTARLRLEEHTLSATPRLPRSGGPLSTARGLSTVLRALPLARVRGVVCPSPRVDHVHAGAGQHLAAETWSLPTWRFHERDTRRGWLAETGMWVATRS